MYQLNLNKFYRDCFKLYNKVIKNLICVFKENKDKFPDDVYAFTNLDEFIVGVFTDSKAIKFLQSIPASKPEYKNLFAELLDYIKSLFNFTE